MSDEVDRLLETIEQLNILLAFSEDAAVKGEKARQTACGMEMEISELKEQNDDLRKRLAEVERLPDVDSLAQIIRRVDGDHKLGAGALAEAILAAIQEASHG